MKRFGSAFLAGILLLSSVPAFSATFQKSDKDVLSVNIPINDNLYVAGGLVHVKEQISGDLIIAGGEVIVTGDVTEDVMGFGGRISIDGSVGDDVRVAGGEIMIRGNVAGDLIIAGGQVRIQEGAVVNGDVVVLGGMLIIDGTLNGSVRIMGGDVYFDGTITGDAYVSVKNFHMNGTIVGDTTLITQTVAIADTASIRGDLAYWLPDEAPDFSTLVSGTTTFDPELRRTQREVVETTMLGALRVALLALIGYSLLASALVILLLVLATKTFFTKTAKTLKSEPWFCLLIGFLYFALTPVIAILLLLTVIGIPLAFFVFMLYGFTIFFAKPLTAVVFAKWAEVRSKKKWSKTRLFFVSIGMYLLLKLIGFVPVFGWILCALLVFAAFGALLQIKWAIWKKVA